MEELKEKKERLSGKERRELILARAKKVFALGSYAEASTSELAKASEISEPMLYKHFGSKKGLFLSVLDEYIERFFNMWQGRLHRLEQEDPLNALAQIGLEYRSAIKADPEILKILFQAIAESGDAEIGQAARRNNQKLRAFIHELLEHAKEQGKIDSNLNLEAATWVYASLGYAMQISLMLNLDDELDENMLVEIHRLWLKAIKP
jgi:AcrR family transcriptional regulator